MASVRGLTHGCKDEDLAGGLCYIPSVLNNLHLRKVLKKPLNPRDNKGVCRLSEACLTDRNFIEE
ncbi:MAG TPA: hypothetical protein DEG93_02665 [Gammaproteobacteria bacterium]|nr:hypothetical protein [Gammaproteobacteria bacterium]HBX99240.1 hypothetical protein [Gammaproteobacteria bacterium]